MTSPSQSLESYFYVYSSDRNGDSRPITFPREASKETGTQKRILEIVSSLAFICVSQAEGEVYATAIRTERSLSEDSAVIYLAGNHGVPDSTAKYLQSVLAQLAAISRSQPTGRDQSPELNGAILRDDGQKLGMTILRHTFPKFLNSLTKRDYAWNTRVEAIRGQLADSPDRLKLFGLIEKGLLVIYESAARYRANTDDTSLKRLYEGLSVFETFIRRGMSSDKLSILLEDLDRTTAYYPWSANSDLVDDDLELDVNDNNALQTGFSMTRFIYRIIAVNIHIRRLLRLAVSSTFQSLFVKDPSIYCCPPAEISVHVDPAALTHALNLDGLMSLDDSAATVTGPLHAELCIFTALLRGVLCEGSAPYWVIGVSKLMCVGCHILIAKAFPRVLQKYSSGLKPFAVQGTHGKMYRPWVAPNLTFATTHLRFDLDHEIRECSKDLLVTALKEYVEQRRLSDSSIGSGTSDKKDSEALGDDSYERTMDILDQDNKQHPPNDDA
ncbi:hypothetical protein GGX14DRAFT_559930 [Mycena pura]|uniref:Uncharacterized protein n=1 Tax=Mycena pura TaxID=153505 RepID=A0AAD6YKH0_9AGAR|nr:hypothetical protein GGX14DRAFT_559930 [Mycena pura]